MKKILLFLSFFVICSNFSFSQFQLSDWTSLSTRMDVECFTFDKDNNIWFGSSGGITKYDIKNNEEIVYNNINSIINNHITALYYDSTSNRIYAGSVDGILEVYDGKTWTHFLDIRNQKFSNSRINDIKIYNNKVYIAGNFGLTIFDPQKSIFIESILKIANFNSFTPISKIYFKNSEIWLATETGIAKSDINSFLPNPQSWTAYGIKEGLFEESINDIAFFGNKTYILSDRFLLLFENEKFEQVGQTNYFFGNFITIKDKLYVNDWFKIYDLNGNVLPINNNVDYQHPAYILDIFYNENSDLIIINYQNFGFATLNNGEYNYIKLNCPISNSVFDMKLDNNGNLWLATNPVGSSLGISKYDGEKWTNYDAKDYPNLKENYYHKISVSEDNRIIISNWGNGVVIAEPNENSLNPLIFDENNSALKPIGSDPKFVVTGQSIVDKNNKIWITNMGEISNGPVLVSFEKNNDTYKSFGISNETLPTERTYINMAIDQNNTKWLAGRIGNGKGLMYFNDMNTLDNTQDDINGIINKSSHPNLLENEFSSIQVDKNGFLWLGTPKGVAIINNPSQVLNKNSKNLNVRTLSRLIGDNYINGIFIDALDNKWIYTINGIWVVDPLASDTLAYINKDKYPIPSNDIKSLVINKNNGKLFISTTLGIYQANSLSVEPLSEYDIKCYPQPFNFSKDLEMYIDGLAEFSEVRILTTSGELIKSFKIESRKTVWDGRDYRGNLVRSGVYIISAKSASGELSGSQKIAVINNN